jgi:hypothetical protein
MHFTALVAITLSAVGVFAAPVVQRADKVAACCGILSGNEVTGNEVCKSPYHASSGVQY